MKIEETSLSKNIATLSSGATLALLGRLGGRSFNLVAQILFARYLGPIAFGLYAIGWSAFRILGVFAPIGTDKAIIRYGTEVSDNRAKLRQIYIQAVMIALIASAVLTAIMFFGSDWLANRVFHDPQLTTSFKWLSLGLPLFAFLKVTSALTRVTENVQFSVVAEDIVQPILLVSLFLVFYSFGLGAISPYVAVLASFAGAVIAVIYFANLLFKFHTLRVPTNNPPTPTKDLKELILFSLPASLASSFTLLNIWADRLMLGALGTMREVGIYQASSQAAIIFVAILSAFSTIFSPMIARRIHEGQLESVNTLYKLSTKWGIYLCTPLFLVIIIFPEKCLSVLFGASYATGSTSLVILAVGQLINVGCGPVASLLVMSGNQNIWFGITGISLILNIALNAALIPSMGLNGAALATSLTLSVIFVAGLVQAQIRLNVFPYSFNLLKGLLAALLTTAVLFLISALSTYSDLITLFAGLVLAFLAFYGSLYLIGTDIEDKVFLDLVKRKLKAILRRS